MSADSLQPKQVALLVALGAVNFHQKELFQQTLKAAASMKAS